MNKSRHLPLKVRLSGNITGTAVPPAAHNRSAHPQRAGFTLLELIVMAAILALVALVLAPGLAHTGPNVRAVQCLSNLAQMQAGANMYPADFNDTMLPNVGAVGRAPLRQGATAAGDGHGAWGGSGTIQKYQSRLGL